MANQSNKYFPSFTPLDSEFSPGCRVIDNFSEHISFNICRKGNNDKSHEQELDKMVLENSSSPSIAIIVSDTSIKSNVATSIAHIHAFDKPLMKMIHHQVWYKPVFKYQQFIQDCCYYRLHPHSQKDF